MWIPNVLNNDISLGGKWISLSIFHVKLYDKKMNVEWAPLIKGFMHHDISCIASLFAIS